MATQIETRVSRTTTITRWTAAALLVCGAALAIVVALTSGSEAARAHDMEAVEDRVVVAPPSTELPPEWRWRRSVNSFDHMFRSAR